METDYTAEGLITDYIGRNGKLAGNQSTIYRMNTLLTTYYQTYLKYDTLEVVYVATLLTITIKFPKFFIYYFSKR